MSKKHEKVCTVVNYIDHLHSLASAVTAQQTYVVLKTCLEGVQRSYSVLKLRKTNL